MPIYEFRCQKCGLEFERLQKISDPDPDRCPACGENAVSRLISAAAFRLKGGGWYETDFKSSNRRNVAESGKSDASKPGGESGSGQSSGKSEGTNSGESKAGGGQAA